MIYSAKTQGYKELKTCDINGKVKYFFIIR